MAEIADKAVVIQNELGLHRARCDQLVQLASKYPCEVTRSRKTATRSTARAIIVGVSHARREQGHDGDDQGEGRQAAEATAMIVKLIEDKFGEDK